MSKIRLLLPEFRSIGRSRLLLIRSVLCVSVWSLMVLPVASSANWSPACLDYPNGIEHWRGIRKSVETVDANAYTLALSACLRSPNAEARDRIAYEVLTYWLRNDRVSEQVADQLRMKLLPWLALGGGTAGDNNAIARAFAALILSELVRHDLNHKRWQKADVDALLSAAITMFRAETDYRGLDSELGWIHTLAHGSDLFWRLAMHELTSPDQQRQILDALASQVNKHGAPAFVFNEGDRMARVVAVIVAREQVPIEYLSGWLETLAAPAPMKSWNEAFASPAGMWRLHNAKLFLRAFRQLTDQQAIAEDRKKALLATLDKALKQLP